MLINVLSKLRRNISRINRNIMSETTQIIVDLSTNKSQEPSSESSDKKSKKPKYDKEERKRMLKIRRQSKKEVKQVGFYDETLTQTDYYFENGLRKVYPYFFFWNTTAKERWFGRTLFDVYSNEFGRAIINQNLEKLIQTGKIKVNNKITSKDYRIKNGSKFLFSIL
jgi:lysosomal alpha-mannosidase